MFPSSFAYHRASSVQDAISLLGELPDARILAGGHSLIPAMKLRLAAPSALIDIGRIESLREIRIDGEAHIGATATYDQIRSDPQMSQAFPILPEAIRVIGDQQVRARGTFGGSVAHADPAADLTAVFLALGGRARVASTRGEREIAADEYFVDLWTTALEPDEMITGLMLPIPADGTRMAYAKHAHPASGYAVVGVAAVIPMANGHVSGARLVVTGATSKPSRLTAAEQALEGGPLSTERISEAADRAAEGLQVIGDPYASEGYRAHLVKVMTRRALERAAT